MTSKKEEDAELEEDKVSKRDEIFCIVELIIKISSEKSGDNSEEDPPVPIPNTEVKLFSADGTWRVTARESRTSPEQRKTVDRQQSFFFALKYPR